MNKKAGLEKLQLFKPLCKRIRSRTAYTAPIPILLDFPLFFNKESGDLG